jgi:hypothetical protein
LMLSGAISRFESMHGELPVAGQPDDVDPTPARAAHGQ